MLEYPNAKNRFSVCQLWRRECHIYRTPVTVTSNVCLAFDCRNMIKWSLVYKIILLNSYIFTDLYIDVHWLNSLLTNSVNRTMLGFYWVHMKVILFRFIQRTASIIHMRNVKLCLLCERNEGQWFNFVYTTMFYQQQRFCTLRIGNDDSELQECCRNFLDLLYGAEVFVEGVQTHKQHLRSEYTVALEKETFWIRSREPQNRSGRYGEKKNLLPCRESNQFLFDEVALRQIFTEYLAFSCQFSFHRLPHTHHHLSSGPGTIDQTVAYVPNGLSMTPLSARQQLDKRLPP
jgi:hypothetical protein